MERARRSGRTEQRAHVSAARVALQEFTDPAAGDSRLYIGGLVLLTALVLRMLS